MSSSSSGNRSLSLVLIVLLVCSLVLAGFFYVETLSLEAELEDKVSALETTQSELSRVQSSYDQLDSRFERLQANHSELKSKYENLTSENDDLMDQVENSLSTMRYFNKEIDDAMSWFSANSNLSNAPISSSQYDTLVRTCFSIDDDECRIRAGCPSLFIDKTLDLHYRDDFDAHWESDKLSSLDEFVEYHGGDCEDYSLFVKAIFNSFLDECDSEQKPVVVESFSDGGDQEYFLDKGDNWFFSDVSLEEFSGYRYPCVVCGSLVDPNTGERSGHCINALTKQPVTSLADLDRLQESILIESQTGEFRGSITAPDDDSFQSHKLSTTLGGTIHYVLTDTDQFLYSEEFGTWMSYGSLNSTLDPVTSRLERTLEKNGVDPDSVPVGDDPYSEDPVSLDGETKELCFFDPDHNTVPVRQVYYYPKSGKTLIDKEHDAYSYEKIALNETDKSHCMTIRTELVDSVGKVTVMIDNEHDTVITGLRLYKEELHEVSGIDWTLS